MSVWHSLLYVTKVAIMNHIAMNLCMPCFCVDFWFGFFRMYLGVELLDEVIDRGWRLQRTSRLFGKWVIVLHFLQRVCRFEFLHILPAHDSFRWSPRRQHLAVLCISLMMMLTVCEFVGPFITSPGEMPTQTLCSIGIWMSYCVLRGFFFIYSRYNSFIKWLRNHLYLFPFFGMSSLLCIVF